MRSADSEPGRSIIRGQVSVVERGEGCLYNFEGQAMEKLLVFIRSLKAREPLANQRLWGSAPNPGVYRIGANGSRESVPSLERSSLLGSLSHLPDHSGCSPAEPCPFRRWAERETSDTGIREQSARQQSNPLLLSLIASTFAQLATGKALRPVVNARPAGCGRFAPARARGVPRRKSSGPSEMENPRML